MLIHFWNTLSTTTGTKANTSDVYTKADADAKFRLITESYTKTQTDTALALKANVSDVHEKTDTTAIRN
jgi:hypothetical protein